MSRPAPRGSSSTSRRMSSWPAAVSSSRSSASGSCCRPARSRSRRGTSGSRRASGSSTGSPTAASPTSAARSSREGAAGAEARTASIGFGFRPAESEHHFVVTVPAGNREDVNVAEHLRFDPETGDAPPSLGFGPADAKLRAVLPRVKWNAIADDVRVEFNRRLKKEGLPAGRWKTGGNPLARLLGKELTLLAWAVEDADPDAGSGRRPQLAGTRARGALVAVHHDRRRDRPRGARPGARLAQGGAVRALREPRQRDGRSERGPVRELSASWRRRSAARRCRGVVEGAPLDGAPPAPGRAGIECRRPWRGRSTGGCRRTGRGPARRGGRLRCPCPGQVRASRGGPERGRSAGGCLPMSLSRAGPGKSWRPANEAGAPGDGTAPAGCRGLGRQLHRDPVPRLEAVEGELQGARMPRIVKP